MEGVIEEMKRINSEMKFVRGTSARMRPRKLGVAAVVACLLLPCIFLVILKPNFDSFSIWNLQISIRTSVQFARIQAVKEESGGSPPSGAQLRIASLSITKKKEEKQQSSLYDTTSNETLTLMHENRENKSILGEEIQHISSPGFHGQQNEIKESNVTITSVEVNSLPHIEEKQRENKSSSGVQRMMVDNATTGEEIQHISSPSFHGQQNEIKESNVTITSVEVNSLPHIKEKQRENKSSSGVQRMMVDNATTDHKQIQSDLIGSKEKSELEKSITSRFVLENKVSCDYSQQRFDTCIVQGDVRVHGTKSSIILASPSPLEASSIKNKTWKIRPYARKWEHPVMETIKEFSIRSSTEFEETSQYCTVNHSIPAIVFSTGGFLGNFFHDFTDVLIPLYITSHQYKGDVQFLVADFNSGWINKYQPILNQLSHHKIINLDQDGNVHCYPQAQVGLLSHKELGVDPTKPPNGSSVTDFREMLRVSFSLKRKSVRSGSKSRPRLLILQRRGSRSFINKREVVGLGRRLGFKVVVAGPEETRNMSRFAQMVNSCDVMMGVHGAGLTNMMFLPRGATLIQIVPWGGLKWACRNDFGQPALDMGVRYLEYEIKEEESSLIQQYPRYHPVFTDPLSIQKQGWNVLWSVFLNKQKVKLDVRRFKPVLLEALQSLHD